MVPNVPIIEIVDDPEPAQKPALGTDEESSTDEDSE